MIEGVKHLEPVLDTYRLSHTESLEDTEVDNLNPIALVTVPHYTTEGSSKEAGGPRPVHNHLHVIAGDRSKLVVVEIRHEVKPGRTWNQDGIAALGSALCIKDARIDISDCNAPPRC